MKKMDLNVFYELGLLQEINRRFLNPMGLSMAFTINEDTGKVVGFHGIIDSRDIDEGFIMSEDVINTKKALIKKENVDRLLENKREGRINKLGYIVQPIKIEE